MRFTITRSMRGHQFAATFDGDSALADITILRDGARVGGVLWDEEGFVPSGLLLLSEIDDSEDIYAALARGVRAVLRDHQTAA